MMKVDDKLESDIKTEDITETQEAHIPAGEFSQSPIDLGEYAREVGV